jgi:hypothetical protein
MNENIKDINTNKNNNTIKEHFETSKSMPTSTISTTNKILGVLFIVFIVFVLVSFVYRIIYCIRTKGKSSFCSHRSRGGDRFYSATALNTYSRFGRQ